MQSGRDLVSILVAEKIAVSTYIRDHKDDPDFKNGLIKFMTSLSDDTSQKLETVATGLHKIQTDMNKVLSETTASMAGLTESFDDMLFNETNIVKPVGSEKEEAKPVAASGSDETKKLFDMIRYIRDWQHNLEFIEKVVYTDEVLIRYLNKQSGNRDMNNLCLDLDKLVNNPNLVEDLKSSMVTEPLRFQEKKIVVSILTDLTFFNSDGEHKIQAISAERLLASRLYRQAVLSSEKFNSRIPLDIKNKEHVVTAIIKVLDYYHNEDYYDCLETIEEIYLFIKLFQYLELEYVD